MGGTKGKPNTFVCLKMGGTKGHPSTFGADVDCNLAGGVACIMNGGRTFDGNSGISKMAEMGGSKSPGGTPSMTHSLIWRQRES